MKIRSFYVADTAQVKEIADELSAAVLGSEQEEHIVTNMVGDVAWSMTNMMLNQSRFRCGYITVAHAQGQLSGIVGCDVNDIAFPNGLQFGIRLWVHPQHRGSRAPTELIAPSLRSAQTMRTTAWTSFNDDRRAMLRMIEIRAKDNDGKVRDLWTGFQTFPNQLMIHNTLQYVAYRDYR